MHDFAADLQAAQADPVLHQHLIGVCLTNGLLLPGGPGIPNPDLVIEVASSLIDGWQGRYTMPKPLRFVISSSEIVENALACWTPTNDWVVVSVGLLSLLSENADRLARDVLHVLSERLDLQMTQRLKKDAGRSAAYAANFYKSAIAFFIGHEIAHLYDGHEGFRGYAPGAGNLNDPGLSHEYQALELGADYAGTQAAARVAMKGFLSGLDAQLVQGIADPILKRELILLVSLGPLLALTLFQPEALKQVLLDTGTHPDDRFRALWMVSNLKMFVEETMQDDENPYAAIEQINLGLNIVLLQNAARNDTLIQLLELAPRDGDIAALRTTGIRRLMFSDDVISHQRLLYEAYRDLKPQLHPFARGPNAMPMQ